MKKICSNITRFFTIFLSLTLVFSVTVNAKSCDHFFGNTDVCSKCGYIRVHTFVSPITFYTYKSDLSFYSKPTIYSQKRDTIEKPNTIISIDGILRNDYGNIWLRITGNKGFIFVDDVYLCLETLAAQNYQQIHAWKNNPASQFVAFFNIVNTNGCADYKRWLDPSNKGILYNVKINSKFYKMTGESLGNIHYGYFGRLLGINEDMLLYGGGALNITNNYDSPFSPICIAIKFIKKCEYSYCDEASDVIDVKRGIHYYDTGVFSR